MSDLPEPVQPQPVPTTVGCGHARGPDGRLLVAIQFQTAVGTNTYFLDPDTARHVGRTLQELAGGIVIADQVPIRPELNGG